MTSTRLVGNTLPLALMALLGALSASACGGGGGTGDCTDGNDNDGDGLIDADDPGCEFNGDLEAPDPFFPECNDRVDNDGDGKVDTLDPGCDDLSDNNEYNEPIGECKDGIDNDGDGMIDFPNDPGCRLSLEDQEDDNCPAGAGCPACGNEFDDDGDGVTDYPDDLGCDSASDNDEFNADPTICGAGVPLQPLPMDGLVEGVLMANGGNELVSPDCGGTGDESVYIMTITSPVSVVITTDYPETTVDTVVYVREMCRDIDTEIGCNDDAGVKVSTLNIPLLQPGEYYLVVDAHNINEEGDFKMTVDFFTPIGEPCTVGTDVCTPGLYCQLADPGSVMATCEPPRCSDGKDFDQDGINDWPFEPGCASALDNDDTDTCPGMGCPECGNGVDDDGDMIADYPADPGCESAFDGAEIDECIPGVEVMSLTTAGATGTTSGTSNFAQSCSFSSSSPEDVYAFNLGTQLQSITYSTIGSTMDTVLGVRVGDCGNTADEIACADPFGSPGEEVTIADPPMGIHFVFVDGNFSSGDYVLNVSGIIAAGNACDPAETALICESGYFCDGGTNTCVSAACNDGIDNDGDMLSDFPDDPGCDSPSDSDETDDCPSGMNCPACSNQIDDDMDGQIDYGMDIGCSSASDNDEEDCETESDPVIGVTMATYTGDTTGLTGDFIASCTTNTTSPDQAHVLQVPGMLNSLTVDTFGSTFDTVLYVKPALCTNADIACNDQSGGNQSMVNLTDVAAGNYILIVDGWGSAGTTVGPYTLNVSGEIAAGEACDMAQITAGIFTCESGTACDGTTCAGTPCNDGMDNDGDMLTDYPNDPGCDSPSDTDETDDCPAGMSCPQCANGMDDDGDGQTDYPSDLGCAAAGDDEEEDCPLESDPITTISMSTHTGDTTGATDDFTSSCQTFSTASDHMYIINFPGMLDSLTVDTNDSSFDTVLFVKTPSCDVADLDCDDDGGEPGTQSLLSLTSVAPGTYFFIVDGYSSNEGTYNFNISGVVGAGEACDIAQETAGIITCAAGACLDMGGGYMCQ